MFYRCEVAADRDKAKAVCADCPVLAECLKTAMDEERSGQSPGQNLKGRFGVRGGLSATERWALAYPEAAEAARRKAAGQKRGRPSKVAEELAAA